MRVEILFAGERRSFPQLYLWPNGSWLATAPFPFANSRPEDFSDERDFGFESDGRAYRCRLDGVRFADAPGDGFIGIELDAAQAPTRIDWHRADGGVQPMGL